MKLSSEKIEKALLESCSTVFEQIAFMDVQGIELLDQIPDVRGNSYYSSIAISEPFSGKLGLLIDNYTMEFFVQNLDEITLETKNINLILDYVNEYLNTIVGNFLELLLDEQPYQIGLPEAAINPDLHQLDQPSNNYFMVNVETKNIYFVFSKNE